MHKKKISLSEPLIIGNELKYLKKCVSTNWVSTSGSFIAKFENSISKFTGAKYAVSCMNGTSALHLSLKVLDIKSDEEILVPSLTFIATINAIIYNNSIPVFMDSDDFFNLDTKKTIEFLKNQTIFKGGYTFNKKTRRKIAAIMPVHVWGNAADLYEIVKICKSKNIKIIEDASESLGTFYKKGKLKNKHTGTIGEIGCLSFNGNKIITSGSGGMILTNNKKIAKKAKYLSTQAKDDSFYSIHDNVGFNYRMSNIQAALGLAQLENIKFYLKKKKQINNLYMKKLKNIKGASIYNTPDYADNNHWMNVLNIDDKVFDKSLNKIITLFKKNNIEIKPVWRLNHKQKMFKNFDKYKIKNANLLLKKSLLLPSSTSLTNKNINNIVNILNA